MIRHLGYQTCLRLKDAGFPQHMALPYDGLFRYCTDKDELIVSPTPLPLPSCPTHSGLLAVIKTRCPYPINMLVDDFLLERLAEMCLQCL